MNEPAWNQQRRMLSEELREQRRLHAERKPNGHLTSCICRHCFELYGQSHEQQLVVRLRTVPAGDLWR